MVRIIVGSLALCVLPEGLHFTLVGLNPLVGFLWGHSISPSVKIPFLCTDQPVGSHFNAVTGDLLVSSLGQTTSLTSLSAHVS